MINNDKNYRKLFLEDKESLIKEADNICRSIHGNRVYVRGLIEFSNHCSMNCDYCGIRRGNSNVHRYRMLPEEIIETAVNAFKRGIKTFVLQGGEDSSFNDDVLCKIISSIKNQTSGEAALTLSVGIRPRESYKKLKDAGADRYLIRFETSDEIIYANLKSGQKLETRLNAIRTIKELGYETGSGFMVNLPGETDETVIRNCELCRELALDMVGIGPFIPHPETPLAQADKKGIETAVKAVALTRILLPYAHIPATTAAATIEPMGREMMFSAGANVVMPNITPEKYKKDYLLYPDKICLDEDYIKCLGCLSGRAEYAGKTIDMSIASALTKTDNH
ncbi:MAG TPA: [FeFe] hydrogenase H-cluster radical SAM maturase HydE [Spirochaetota bacterium]|nr:[FeFe] hydrogenase H-cluster radical SAM maturase HydE [Spirochaetota bacterium]HOR43213.1 [FeFe] hydrogenase H-cluster radical SAM maturase HydE [Spirochaetota bacterium]HPK55560.1 [FeFe] hydrogenase H-cluster radical SAM maturase HydE [Spirochaetota bacterium]